MKTRHRFLTVYMAVLLIFTVYTLLDTFIITRVYGEESYSADTAEDARSGNEGYAPDDPSYEDEEELTSDADSPGSSYGGASSLLRTDEAAVIDTYSANGTDITLYEFRENDTTIYVADICLSDASELKTALANGAYGHNVTAATSEIASEVGAVLAINGDYYGAQESGYVIRNGVLYRDTAGRDNEDLVIYSDGSFGIISESEVSASELISSGAVQTLSFGPALVQDGEVTVSEGEEVGKAMASNPRTAIGIVSEGHYVFVVSDGRTSESAGLSLHELAGFMDSIGVTTAYNLDGGGSSTMYFKGEVVNNPTTGGKHTRERSVSDIVYIGQ